MTQLRQLILMGFLLIIVVFQNCSDVSFDSTGLDEAGSVGGLSNDPSDPSNESDSGFGDNNSNDEGFYLSGDSLGVVSLGATNKENFNIVYLLDVSGSISNSDMDVALDAFRRLTQKYSQAGLVNLTFVRFGSRADIAGRYSNIGSGGTDGNLDDAIADLRRSNGGKFTPGGTELGGRTNYSDGLENARAVLDAVTLMEGYKNVLYFFTDGVPNEGTIRDLSQMNDYLQNTFNTTQSRLDLKVHSFGVPPIISSGTQIIAAIDNTPMSPVEVNNYQDLDFALSETVVIGNLTARGTVKWQSSSSVQLLPPQSGMATYGQYSVDSQGRWIYSLNGENQELLSRVAALGNGEFLKDPFPLLDADGKQVGSVMIHIFPAQP